MLGIGQLCRRFKLARSTLLYYDRIGILCPSMRTDANYRVYSEEDVSRLDLICRYRSAGLSLELISKILDSPHGAVGSALEKRFSELDAEIANLRDQQRVIADILGEGNFPPAGKNPSLKMWKEIFLSAGFDEAAMRQWHRRFEETAPASHQAFLEMLGLPAEDVRDIRARSRKSGCAL